MKPPAKLTHYGKNPRPKLTHLPGSESILLTAVVAADEEWGDAGSGDDCEDPEGTSWSGRVDPFDCARLGVSRNTVRKVVRGGATEHRYERGAAQPRPKLDGFIHDLEGLLEANEKRKPRDRLTLKTIWSRLCDRGCEAGYEAVRRYARQWAGAAG